MVHGIDRPPEEIPRRDFMMLGAGAALFAAGTDASGTAAAQTDPDSAPPPTGAPGKIDLERRGRVLLIGINRPDALNRADPPILVGIGKGYYQLEHDDELRVAVLHGVGPNFCRALDVPAITAPAANFIASLRASDVIVPMGLWPPFRTKPVVVAVQGLTWGVGHELFLYADIRVAASDTRFRHPEVAFGVFPGGGATARFTREAGWANAMRYMLTGEEWGADEAHRMGLVQEVTPPGKQLDRAVDLANKIAAAAPLGVRATLASARQAVSGEEPALAAAFEEFRGIVRSEDAKEGQLALREGRKPEFHGR
jgi:enoyl-CoA hydratase